MMVSDAGGLKVLDFGIARMLGSARLTRAGATVGTLGYMPPEQIRGEEIDGRSDLYSLGIVLYKMLTGRVPFTAEGQYELMRAQLEQLPSPIRRSHVEIPQSIDDAIRRTLAKAPAERFQSAGELIGALAPALRGHAAEPRAGERRSAARGAPAGWVESRNAELLPTLVPVDEGTESASSAAAGVHGRTPLPAARDRGRPPMKSIVAASFVIAGGALLAYTNPSLDSYQQYLRLSILKETKDLDTPLEQVLGNVLGGVASGLIASQTVREDYVFWSTYETRLTDLERLRAVGVLKNFIVIENPAASARR